MLDTLSIALRIHVEGSVRRSVAFLLLSATLVSGQRLARTIAYLDEWATTPYPSFLAYDSTSRRVYIGGDSGVTAVDTRTRERVASWRLPGVTEPCPAAGGSVLYCLTHRANRIYRVDVATGRIADSLQLPGEFSIWCYSSRQDRLYVFLPELGCGLSIDCAANRAIDTLRCPWDPYSVMYYPARNKLYYTSANDSVSSLTIVDCESDSVLAHHVFAGDTWLTSLCVSVASDRVYCGSWPGTLFVVDGSSNAVKRRVVVSSRNTLVRVCYNPASSRLFCADGAGFVYVVDAATEQVVGRTEVTDTYNPVLLVSPKSNKVYLGNADDCWCMEREVDVLDGTDGTMLARFPHLYTPYAMCWDPVADVVYCTNSGHNEVLVIDCCGDTILDALPTYGNPRSLCWNPDERLLFVIDESHRITAINPDGGEVIGSRVLPAYPRSLACEPDLNRLLVLVGAGEPYGLLILDGRSGDVLQQVASAAVRAYVAPRAHKVYCSQTDSLTVVDLRTGAITGGIRLPGFDRYEPLIFAAQLNRAYARTRDFLLVVDTESDSVVAKWSPVDAVLGRNSHLQALYVMQDETLKALDERTGDLLASATIRLQRRCFAVNEPMQRLYCAMKDPWRLLTLDGRTLTPLDTTPSEAPIYWMGYWGAPDHMDTRNGECNMKPEVRFGYREEAAEVLHT